MYEILMAHEKKSLFFRMEEKHLVA